MKRLLRPLSVAVVMTLLASMMTLSAFSATKDDNSVGADISVVSTGAYTNSSENYKTYSGNDLGANYTPSATTFKVWAPSATKVQVKLYKTGSDAETGAAVIGTYDMTKDDSTGVWTLVQSGDLKNVYYTYLVSVNGKVNETRDVYSKSTGVNGKRSMVVDMDSCNPDGWSSDKHVLFDEATDAMVWEVSVRDFSLNATSGVDADKRGKFLGMAQHGTTLNGAGNVKTGIDYLVENNINCVQIMPMYDFGSVDETKGGQNWGYDPYNYNVPEGSFSSDPYHGEVRVKELKTMIKALHDAGISVIMDVVYNHVYGTADSAFELTVPGYYFRMNGTQFLNGSGCGNVTASDKVMYRKYMIDSLKYWANEYHVDGFRFDLMGCHDITTMNQARAQLDTIDKRIIMYGEPWTGTWPRDPNGIADSAAALMDNASKLDARIGCFNDKMRDGLRGNNDNWGANKGYCQGASGFEYAMKAGAMANTATMFGNNWSKAPSQTVTYTCCHDNLTLWDKIMKSNGSTDYDGTNGTFLAQNKIAAALTFTSQGIAFTIAGEEFARTKKGEDNSYNTGDEDNKMDWSRVVKYKNLVEYYRGLKAIRQVYSPFTDSSMTSVGASYFVDGPSGVVAYTMQNKTKNAAKEWGMTAVLANNTGSTQSVTLKAGTTLPSQWATIVNGTSAGLKNLGTISGNTISIPARSVLVLVDKASFDAKNIQEPTKPTATNPTTTSTSTTTGTTAPKTNPIYQTMYIMKDNGEFDKFDTTEATKEKHFTKTLTSKEGYKIDYVRVITGNKDVTAQVYNKDTSTIDMDISDSVDITVVYVPDASGEVRLYGDVNGDGNVNVSDATTVQKASTRIITLDDTQKKAADVNGDGSINVTDATTIQKFANRVFKEFTVGVSFGGGETPTYTIPEFTTNGQTTTPTETTPTTTETITTTSTTAPLPSGSIRFVSELDNGQERWAAYFWSGTGADATWVDVSADGTVSIPSGAENVIFVRFDGTSTVNEWNEKTVWNQTTDLTLGSGSTYTVTGWGDGWGAKLEGAWS